MHAIHQKGYIHRDIKPQNILVKDNKVLKITDFGFAKPVGIEKAYTFCGTDDFMAPEILEETGHNYKVDIWALGIFILIFQKMTVIVNILKNFEKK